MSYYGEEMKWKRIAAGVLVALALIVLAFKYFQPRDVSIRWDTRTINRGEMATLWVNIKNSTKETMDLVIVRVEPISPYLTVYSGQDFNTTEFRIPKLASGAEAIAKFGIYVDPKAYAGDHAVRITVAMPGNTYIYESKIRVV